MKLWGRGSAFDVVVARGCEEVHQRRLDGLGVVGEALCAHLQLESGSVDTRLLRLKVGLSRMGEG